MAGLTAGVVAGWASIVAYFARELWGRQRQGGGDGGGGPMDWTNTGLPWEIVGTSEIPEIFFFVCLFVCLFVFLEVTVSTCHGLDIYIFTYHIYVYVHVYIYLAPVCLLCWGFNPRKEGQKFNQSKGWFHHPSQIRPYYGIINHRGPP